MAEPQSVSPARARQHEALVVRLEALLRELRPLAARQPEGRVGEALRGTAEALLWDAMHFRPRRRRDALPVAAATLGALAVQLGEARAGLEAFELMHAGWSNKLKAFAWHTGGRPMPVSRLRPESAEANPDGDKMSRRRHGEILRQFEARIERAYQEGYKDALTGKPASGSLPWKHRG